MNFPTDYIEHLKLNDGDNLYNLLVKFDNWGLKCIDATNMPTPCLREDRVYEVR